MKFKFTGLAIFMMLCLTNTIVAEEATYLDSGRFALGGYGDVGYIDSDSKNSAFSARFVPIFLFQLNDKIHVETELEFSVNEEGETETELEYADLHYFLTDRATITAGKFLLPFGQFGPNLHPSWINRLPSIPGTYGGHGGNGLMSGVLPILSDQGIALQYTFALPGRSKIFLDVYAVNGFSAEAEEHGEEGVEEGVEEEVAHEALFPEIEFEASAGDNNDNKAIGGRVAFAFLPQLEIGFSAYRSQYDDAAKLDFNANALDINWMSQYWSVRGEYLRTDAEAYGELVDHDAEEAEETVADDDHDEPILNGPKLGFDRSGWYLQTAWQLRQLAIPALNSVELVLRHSRTRQVDEGRRWTLGLNYWLTPSAAIKFAYEDTQMDDGRDDTRIFAQLSFGF